MTSNNVAPIEAIKETHRALAVLRALERAPCYRLNELVLLDLLRVIALAATRDELNSTARSLETFGLVRLGQYDDNRVFELTEHGQDVALGRATAEGVLRPGPDCPY
ncbi:MAG: ArsR family transcriptional regulator [Pseudomonadota bacterium]|uniref:VpaChn25_0724 family phage protein n=1 Tax=Pseudooceanicola nitratireducens TaxID=517719 RepID=UPI002EA6313C|nr:ArsR family transcriptional regulator [Pseudomonadota bacterium]